MDIGIVGTGNVAQAVARGWVAAGHDVVLGSRVPEGRVGLPAPVVSVAEAVVHGRIVVNATPGTESVAVLTGVGAQAFTGKTIVDIAVGFTAEGLSHPRESLGEEIQRAFPGVPVVKTLATVTASVMSDPGRLTEPGTVFVSGDDAAAKAEVTGLLTDLGWPRDSVLDLGGIATAGGQEHFALLFLGIAGALGTHEFNVKVVPLAPKADGPTG
ncbi:NADPH-dependent F420 reductase [Yinghuangia sp. YIM S09857]|uniref:NADPH-dependent F420 reductase n=1 Tax=Yinghuangia sp. YIM S09857 TaxID=3436929 RepID=UPI003F536F39